MIGLLQLIQLVGLAVAVFFILALFAGLSRRARGKSDGHPTVSVLVAARNEEATLPQLLQALQNQDYPADRTQIIIVDDGSTDRTAAIVTESAQSDPRFRLLQLEDDADRQVGPKKRALTAALKQATGEIVLITDADCTVRPEWISQMVSGFDAETAAVCGPIRYTRTSSFWSHLAAFDGLVNTILNAAVIGLGGALSCAGANFAYRRERFFEVGGYDQGGRSLSGDDDLLLQKFRAAGLKVQYQRQPSVTVSTIAPQNQAEYWQRKRRHLSAGKRYPLHWIVLAFVIYLGSLSSVVLGILQLSGWNLAAGSWTMWLVFSLALWAVFNYGLVVLKRREYRVWALLIALLFPLLFVLLQPLTLLPSSSWKGRR